MFADSELSSLLPLARPTKVIIEHPEGVRVTYIYQEGKFSEIAERESGRLTITESILHHHRRKLRKAKVFIVHGHDDSMKLAVARTLEKLELEPIILHEQPNLGRTIIEKFTDYSGVSFAVVLLSPDDIGHSRNAPPEQALLRARQNVILELGYFLGKLGRERVIALYRSDEKFEMPSDYSGVLYVAFDAAERWQFDLVRELKASGYNVDANRLLD